MLYDGTRLSHIHRQQITERLGWIIVSHWPREALTTPIVRSRFGEGGTALVAGYSIDTQRRKVQQRIG